MVTSRPSPQFLGLWKKITAKGGNQDNMWFCHNADLKEEIEAWTRLAIIYFEVCIHLNLHRRLAGKMILLHTVHLI